MFFLHLLPDIISDLNYNFTVEFMLSVKDILLHVKKIKYEKMALYVDAK